MRYRAERHMDLLGPASRVWKRCRDKNLAGNQHSMSWVWMPPESRAWREELRRKGGKKTWLRQDTSQRVWRMSFRTEE